MSLLLLQLYDPTPKYIKVELSFDVIARIPDLNISEFFKDLFNNQKEISVHINSPNRIQYKQYNDRFKLPAIIKYQSTHTTTLCNIPSLFYYMTKFVPADITESVLLVLVTQGKLPLKVHTNNDTVPQSLDLYKIFSSEKNNLKLYGCITERTRGRRDITSASLTLALIYFAAVILEMLRTTSVDYTGFKFELTSNSIILTDSRMTRAEVLTQLMSLYSEYYIKDTICILELEIQLLDSYTHL